ncbi:chorismate mutase [Methanobacterium lacus]|uniref:Chorismate mutase n=1 Tax=Methanobacterium lacus (strain AL-21) TaxID=877455 RepID=F0TAY3_METLA|nr:chorismate mutase [Methanobacterium lacus]ADZ10129.1 chorismate mutase [Methanobacterium lacus]UTB31950.1 MAG: chorismate mutase [Methanobacterium sp. ERen5]
MDKEEASRLLQESRTKIDEMDELLIDLVEKRTLLARDIVNAKLVLGIEIEDKKREAYIHEKIKQIAREKNIDEVSLTSIIKILTDMSKKEQNKILRR